MHNIIYQLCTRIFILNISKVCTMFNKISVVFTELFLGLTSPPQKFCTAHHYIVLRLRCETCYFCQLLSVHDAETNGNPENVQAFNKHLLKTKLRLAVQLDPLLITVFEFIFFDFVATLL